jgi:hypothetical protein
MVKGEIMQKTIKLIGEKTCIIVTLVIMLLAGIVTLSFSNTHAANNNSRFMFQLRVLTLATTNPEIRYRQTWHNQNPWKVNFSWSAEGKNTKVQFRLTNYNSSWFSTNWKTVRQGKIETYYGNPQINRAKVQLQGCNNNMSRHKYTIQGYWDEETW